MMTNGQHDDAWLDVMTKRVPTMAFCSTHIANSLRWSLMLKLAKEEHENGMIDDDEYKDFLSSLDKHLDETKN